MNHNELTLTEIARLLNQPQHRLIYLCEKYVVVPDGTDAKGRGSSRRFSERNLFEFSVALTLSKFHIPANVSKSILSTIRSFETEVRQDRPEFRLPQSLAAPEAPELNIVLTDGSRLSFMLGISGQVMKTVGTVDLSKSVQEVDISVAESEFVNTKDSANDTSWISNSLHHAYFVVNLTKVATEIVETLDSNTSNSGVL